MRKQWEWLYKLPRSWATIKFLGEALPDKSPLPFKSNWSLHFLCTLSMKYPPTASTPTLPVLPSQPCYKHLCFDSFRFKVRVQVAAGAGNQEASHGIHSKQTRWPSTTLQERNSIQSSHSLIIQRMFIKTYYSSSIEAGTRDTDMNKT